MAIKKAAIAFLALPFLLCFAMPAICQDESDYDQAATEDEYSVDDYESLEFGLGRVVEITDNTIMVSEDGDIEGVDLDISYIVDAETKFVNINSLSEIKKGDIAYIDYINKNGKRLALNIDIESEETE